MSKSGRTLGELAELTGGEVKGDPAMVISGLADFDSAGKGQITFLLHLKDISRIDETKASAVIAPLNTPDMAKPLILVKNPNLAAAIVHNAFLAKEFVAQGVSEFAYIGDDCIIPEEVSVAPLVVLGDRVRLGRRVKLHSGVVVADDVEIGDDCIFHPNVSVLKGSRIGARVTIHSGSVIGSDGFGYATDENGRHVKRPHVGFVQIDEDVEIGANVCVDRGTFGKTWIMRGSKIDNLVQIAHNVVVGEGSIIVSQSGVAGSSKLGRNVVVGGQVAIRDHIELGDRAMVAGRTGVTANVASGEVVAGFPSMPHKKWLRVASIYQKLPEMSKDINELRKSLDEILRKMDLKDDSGENS